MEIRKLGIILNILDEEKAWLKLGYPIPYQTRKKHKRNATRHSSLTKEN